MSDGGALSRVRSDAQARVKAKMQEILIHNNDVGGYKYNATVTLIKQTNRVLEQQLFKESADEMVGLGSKNPNTLKGYQSNVAIKKSDVKKQSIAEDQAANPKDNIFAPEITTNANSQDKLDRQKTARLAAIGGKGGHSGRDRLLLDVALLDGDVGLVTCQRVRIFAAEADYPIG